MEKVRQRLKITGLAFIWGASGLCAAIALLVLGGWLTKNLPLVQIHPEFPAMQFNTALCFLGSCLSLVLLNTKWRRSALLPAGLSGLLAGLTLMQYATGASYGIDTLFIEPFTAAGTTAIGRMAPNTAAAFLFLNIALTVCVATALRGLSAFTGLLAASLATALGIVPLLGYVSQVEAAYGWKDFAGMAIHTAFCFMLLGMATLTYAWRKLGNAFWMPLPMGIGLVVVALSMAYALHSQEHAHLKSIVQAEAEHLTRETERQFMDIHQALWRISRRWQSAGGTPESLWRSDSRAYLQTYPYLRALIRFDPSGKAVWKETKAHNADFSKMMAHITEHAALSMKNIKDRNIPLNIGTGGLSSDTKTYIISFSLYHGQANDGVMIAVLDVEKFFQTLLTSALNARIFLSASQNDETIFSMSTSVDPNHPYKVSLSLESDITPNWVLHVQPTESLERQTITRLPWVVLIAGLLISSFAVFSLILLLRLQLSDRLLKERKAKLRAAMQDAADGIVLINGQGQIEEFNSACEILFGYEAAEVMGKNVKILMPEPYHREHDGYLKNYQQTGVRKIIGIGREVKGKRKDGMIFDIDLRVSEVKIPGRTLYMGMFRDITERKKLEQETAKLIAVIEESSEFIGMADMEGNLQYHNPSAKKMVGLPDDFDMSKLKIADMHPAFAFERMKEKVLPKVMEKGVWKGENILLHQDGREIPVLQTLVLHKDATGTPLYITTIIQDISLQKAQEEALRRSEEGLQLGWKGTGIGLWDWDIVTNRLNFSDRLKELLGYHHNEISDQFPEWESRVHPDDLAPTLEKLQAHLAQEGPYDTEYRMRTKNGEWHWYHASGQAAWSQEGKPLRMAGSLEDITHRKQAEEMQRHLMDKLAESNTELERFAYVASHDLRGPLRLIANFAALLKKEYARQLDSGGQEYIGVINESAMRMHSMVGDLLEYARIGNEEMRYSKVSMEDQMRQVKENLASFIAEHRASITHDALPEVMGNPIQLMRLLQNLVGNAIKFHAKDTLPQVHVSVKEQENYWRFEVKDNGIGMAPEYTTQIFEPFRQLHARNEYMGTGIGLAICKRIVEKHGGIIGVESEPEKGSVFYFTISN
ncbi:PAS domain S-box protein [bacterium]|nr:PAS domain S-box protein [bacterium]